MLRFIIVSIGSGFLFGILDGTINGNPYARKLFEVYDPISKTAINIPAGIVIDLIYGFIMAGLFVLLYQSLPGATGLIKGLSYAGIIWFFRVLMYAVTQWMMFRVPAAALFYMLWTGLIEMGILGILYGTTLRP